VLFKARAALRVLKELDGIFKLSRILGVLPTFLLNAGYDLIAKHRYRVFGKHDSCVMPLPEHRERFVGMP
jgi:predicted DCC family thiol-disulfide oxidoreductase YuxK